MNSRKQWKNFLCNFHKNMRSYLLFFCFLLLGLFYFESQILGVTTIMNPQFLLAKDDRVNSLGAAAGMMYYSGNTNLIRADAGLTGRLILDRTLLLLVSEGGYRKENDIRDLNKTMEHIRIVQDLSDIFSFEAFGQYQFDEFLRLKKRVLGGFGSRFSIYKHSLFELSLGTSYIREMNHLSDGSYADSGSIVNVDRWSNYFYFQLLLNDNLSLYSTLYYQPQFNNFDNYRLFSTIYLKVKIQSEFSIFIRNNILYDSRPPENVKAKDVEMQTGFTFLLKQKK